MSKNLILTMFFIVHISLFFYVYPVKMIESTSKGHWEPILVGFLTEMLFVWVYLNGLSVFPGKDIVDIFHTMINKWLTKILIIPFIVFLFMNFSLIHRYEFDSVNVLLLPKTPMMFILLLYLIPFYIAWKGIEAIIRGGVALFVCVSPMILLSFLSGWKNLDFDHIFPLLDTRLSFFKEPEYYSSFFVHSGFLFLGFIQMKQKLKLRNLISLLSILFIFGLASVYLPMLIFGPESIVYFRYPNVLTLDTVDTEWVVIDWLPTFFVISMIAISMVEGAVSFWMMTTLMQKLFFPKKRGLAVISLGILSYVFSSYISNIDRLERLITWNTFFCFYSIAVIPLTLLMMSLRYRRNPA